MTAWCGTFEKGNNLNKLLFSRESDTNYERDATRCCLQFVARDFITQFSLVMLKLRMIKWENLCTNDEDT